MCVCVPLFYTQFYLFHLVKSLNFKLPTTFLARCSHERHFARISKLCSWDSKQQHFAVIEIKLVFQFFFSVKTFFIALFRYNLSTFSSFGFVWICAFCFLLTKRTSSWAAQYWNFSKRNWYVEFSPQKTKELICYNKDIRAKACTVRCTCVTTCSRCDPWVLNMLSRIQWVQMLS